NNSLTSTSNWLRNSRGLHLLFRQNERCFFIYGYAKSDMANISDQEERAFKLMASHVLNLTGAQLNALIANGAFEEVT
ncbi:MAG: type II toxin-antitoxin system RelE/ParE family toxin, partial [Limnohabitans sp.]